MTYTSIWLRRLFAPGALSDKLAAADQQMAQLQAQRFVEGTRTVISPGSIWINPLSTRIWSISKPYQLRSFSGGQKQRILLARALYKEPRILFLDEATSHLDAETENKINRVISTLGIARVVVAHRQETIQSCDRVLVLEDGQLRLAAWQSSRTAG